MAKSADLLMNVDAFREHRMRTSTGKLRLQPTGITRMAAYRFLLSEAQPITSGRIKHLIVKGAEFPSTCTPTEIKELCISMMAHIVEAEKTPKEKGRDL